MDRRCLAFLLGLLRTEPARERVVVTTGSGAKGRGVGPSGSVSLIAGSGGAISTGVSGAVDFNRAVEVR